MSFQVKFEGSALRQLHGFTASPGWDPFLERVL
ncbi:hypothetical protein FHU30_004233 [Actinomadura rupiterrae]|nr:hypothetical protein [Actinomadura rupiterrae]